MWDKKVVRSRLLKASIGTYWYLLDSYTCGVNSGNCTPRNMHLLYKLKYDDPTL